MWSRELDIAGETFEGPRLQIFHPGDRITVRATHAARMMFVGGAALEGPRYIWWNFRVLAQGTDRASQRRLEDREIRAGAGRNRVHSASRFLGKSRQLGNQILAHRCANSALFGHAPTALFSSPPLRIVTSPAGMPSVSISGL
jgi:hypothetical protein